MSIKFFAGTWDSWGFNISYDPYVRGLSVNIIHWYFGFEIWGKK